ncbi:MAG: type II toxin-antitoxin system VapC family toxin [Rhodospirillales bacterium]|nr:type II toxin-antitoxin system VapC family toxin [Rhodospirillales bacterium]
MKILLDTSYLYDLMMAPGKLLDVERRFLGGPAVRLHVSAVSIWEMRLKHDARHRSGTRKSPFDPNAVLAVLEDQEVVFVPMTMRHAAWALDVPLAHRDPFDELLLVQAQEEGLRLLTADRLLADHPLAITIRGRV